jgi:hypothetical protein
MAGTPYLLVRRRFRTRQFDGALDLAKTDTEDIALITETAFLLCKADPKTTGRLVQTQAFLREVGWLQ